MKLAELIGAYGVQVSETGELAPSQELVDELNRINSALQPFITALAINTPRWWREGRGRMDTRTGQIIPGELLDELKKKAAHESEIKKRLDEFKEMAIPPTPRQKMKMKVGRNDPCPCGSGLKFKKCCLIADDESITSGTPEAVVGEEPAAT